MSFSVPTVLCVLHQYNHQFTVVSYFDGDVFSAIHLQDAARPQFLPFPAVKQKYRAAFGLGNQQGVAGVVVAGDFLAFGQGFADDGVVFTFKNFARALGGFSGRHGGGEEADEGGEKLVLDVFHGGFPLVAGKNSVSGCLKVANGWQFRSGCIFSSQSPLPVGEGQGEGEGGKPQVCLDGIPNVQAAFNFAETPFSEDLI